MTRECETHDSHHDPCRGTLVAEPTDSVYRKQPLSEATLDALEKLVARGGVAGHAAQEMLNAELVGADADYAARIARIANGQHGASGLRGTGGKQATAGDDDGSPRPVPTSRSTRLWARIRAWFGKA